MSKHRQQPRISVVIPFYDLPGEYLFDALASLQSQGFQDWEAIVVDDASPQLSATDVARRFEEPRFRVVTHSENQGLGAARNTGFRVSNSALVAMLDADDRLHPDFLESMVAALEAHPDAGWAWTDLRLFGASNGEWRFPSPLPEPCPAHLDYRGGSSVIRRSLWESVGGFTEDRLIDGLEDLDFWLGALTVGSRPTHVPGLLYEWRISDGSMTSRVSPNNHLQINDIFGRRQSVFGESPPPCEQCGRRNRGAVFRSRGYFNSSVHSLRTARRWRALRFALIAAFLQPTDKAVARQLIRSLVPGPAGRALRWLKQWRRAGA